MKYQTINAGDHFGRLETLERIKIGRRIAWICKCSCGNTRAVLSQNLNNGTTKSGIYADIYHSRKCDAIRVILVSA